MFKKLSSTLKYASNVDGPVLVCRRQSEGLQLMCKRNYVMRKDQTERHRELIERDKTDKHRYYKWNYQPLPTQTVLDDSNPLFSIRSPEFKLPNPRGRLSKRIWRQRIAEVQQARQDPELEKLARHRKLLISIDDIDRDWRNEFGLLEVDNLARFYEISNDLFKTDDVILNTWLNVAFNDLKIHRGNILTPSQLLEIPSDISLEAQDLSSDNLHTLIVSNLDGHPTDSSKEIIHWMVCNIENGQFNSADTIFNYIPPLPWQGTGFHRFVFTLYKQKNGLLDTLESLTPRDQHSLKARSMTSHDIANTHCIQPVGISWCQVAWDQSVSESCKQITELHEEPVYDWEDYVEPKENQSELKTQLSELRYRNM